MLEQQNREIEAALVAAENATKMEIFGDQALDGTIIKDHQNAPPV